MFNSFETSSIYSTYLCVPWSNLYQQQKEMCEKKSIIQSDYKIFSKEYNSNYNRLKPYSITNYTQWYTENNINIKEKKEKKRIIILFSVKALQNIFFVRNEILILFCSSFSSLISFFYCLTHILRLPCDETYCWFVQKKKECEKQKKKKKRKNGIFFPLALWLSCLTFKP